MEIDFREESVTVSVEWSVNYGDEEYEGTVTFHDDYSRMSPTFNWNESPDDEDIAEKIEEEVIKAYYERKNK